MTRSPNHFLAVPHLGVSVLRRSYDTKTPRRQNLVFGPKTSSEHTTKRASLGPRKPSIPRPTRRMRAYTPIEQPTTITLSVRGCIGGRLARGVRGSHAEGRRYVGTKHMGDPPQTILARLEPNDQQCSPAHLVRRWWVALCVYIWARMLHIDRGMDG